MLLKKIEVLNGIDFSNDETLYSTVSGVQGIALEFDSLDSEVINENLFKTDLNTILLSLKSDTQVKIISKAVGKNNEQSLTSRTSQVNKIGFREYKNYFLLEKQINPLHTLHDWIFDSEFRKKSASEISTLHFEDLKTVSEKLKNITVEINKDVTFKVFKNAKKEDLESLFLPIGTELIKHEEYISIFPNLFGIVRIKSNTNKSLTIDSLVNVRNKIEFDHEVITSFQKLTKTTEEILMNGLKTEANSATSFADLNRKEEVERLEDAISNMNEALFDVEMFIKVPALNEAELKKRLMLVSTLLEREFGSFYVETFGVFSSFTAAFPGSRPHVTFREVGSGLIFYSPLFAHNSIINQVRDKKTLLMHRRGKSLQAVNLISNFNKSGNSLIIGPKGSGKSVLTGLITQSALNDPTAKIIKMDVGSSYVRECEQYGGTRYNLKLNEPSGLNPLSFFAKTPHDLEIAQIATDFIEVLISKNVDGRFGITDEERAVLDKIVITYSASRPTNPSLDDFLQFGRGQIPNEILLERWTSGGMYENIFKPIPNNKESRYRYFDFESVSNASNPNLVRGSIAAVMAQYNSEAAISGRTGPRIYFFCDETTEFLNYCAPFFITTMKNSRKFGHLIILINQGSLEFQVIDRQGKLSNALFENADHHFFYAPPVDPEAIVKFKSHHNLSGIEFKGVQNLMYEKGKYSEVFYKNNIGGLTLRIELSREEYWLLTTDKNDNDKIEQLVQMGFTKLEAMKCLSERHLDMY